jgi:hypothetical protein
LLRTTANPQAPDAGWSFDAAAWNAQNLNGASCVGSDAGLGVICRSASGGYKAVSVGRTSACVLANDGSVSCWQSGDFSNAVYREQPPGTFTNVDVASGATLVEGEYACGVAADQTLQCWGQEWDILGHPGYAPPLPSGQFTSVSASANNGIVCGIRTNGRLACWGHDVIPPDAGPSYFNVDAGPDGGFPESVTDQYLPSSAPGPFTQVSVGSDDTPGRAFACAVRVDGSVQCWPNNVDGGVPPAGSYEAIQTKNSCGIQADGTITCWGPEFQCTPGDATCAPIPTGAFQQIDTSGQFGCGIRTDGSLACWGNTLLTPPPPDGTFTSLGVGFERACAIDAQGYAVCWGRVFSMP